MRFEHFVGIIDQFPRLKELHLQGLGEPMMHPRFFDMVAHASQKGITVTTNSNLTLMSEARAERTVTSGLASLHISFDGATTATYEDIRLGAKFDAVLHNVEKVRRTRIRLQSLRPALRLIVVIMRRNLQELPDLIRLAHALSVSSVFVQHLGQEFGESALPPEYEPMRRFIERETLMGDLPRVERYFHEARAVANEFGIELRLPRLQPLMDEKEKVGRSRCEWPWNGSYITYQGYAIPCCMIATPDRGHMGNMIDVGVNTVWNGLSYQEFRNRLASHEPPEVCRSCSVYKGIF
jgi:radical SAM protein with 4Fe4S-binding SPASM domain